MIKHYTQIPVTSLGDILSRHFSGSREAVNTAYPKLFGLVKMYMEAIQPDFSFIEDQKESCLAGPSPDLRRMTAEAYAEHARDIYRRALVHAFDVWLQDTDAVTRIACRPHEIVMAALFDPHHSYELTVLLMRMTTQGFRFSLMTCPYDAREKRYVGTQGETFKSAIAAAVRFRLTCGLPFYVDEVACHHAGLSSGVTAAIARPFLTGAGASQLLTTAWQTSRRDRDMREELLCNGRLLTKRLVADKIQLTDAAQKYLRQFLNSTRLHPVREPDEERLRNA